MNKVENCLEKMYKIAKENPTGEKIIFLVKNTSDYLVDGYILEKLGYEVEIQEWEDDILNENKIEQVRRADVLADYVYIEEDSLTKVAKLPIRPEKDINGVNGTFAEKANCYNVGLDCYLNYENFNLYGKHVTIMGLDNDLVDRLTSSGATVTIINPYVRPSGMTLNATSLLIILPNYKEKVNVYPIHIPVIDCGGRCINTENRNVITDTEFFRVIGMMVQMTW